MSTTTLQITGRDPIIVRDGRPFGAGQGNRMRGLGWPLPSVVAGSFRTALVKSHADLDFGDGMPRRLMAIEVAGVFPTVGSETVESELYLPAPNDCVWNGETGEIHSARPFAIEDGGCDFPIEGLRPVVYSDDHMKPDFKPKPAPAWWPVSKLADWLLGNSVAFDANFLSAGVQEDRDHVCLDADTGAAAEGQIFATAGLNVTHLPRYGIDREDKKLLFDQRFQRITLSARVTLAEKTFEHVERLNTWHPLGGERRLVHWKCSDAANMWTCPAAVKSALGAATRIRMVLATPAIFGAGWKPAWLKDGLEGTLPGTDLKLRLVGVSNGRWKAVSGWSLAKINDKGQLDPNGRPGPKAIRRMVPAGSVYFFEVKSGEGVALVGQWLNSVSDGEQDRRDGFGLAVWGAW